MISFGRLTAICKDITLRSKNSVLRLRSMSTTGIRTLRRLRASIRSRWGSGWSGRINLLRDRRSVERQSGDGTISRGNETILPMVAMVRIEDLSSGEWIRQGANVWQVAKACAPDQNTRMLELKQGPTTYKVRMSLATMVERVQQTEEQ